MKTKLFALFLLTSLASMTANAQDIQNDSIKSTMLNPVVIKGMNDLGIQIHNGYGITECGPLISMNADTLDEHLSVGPACPGLEVKIENPDEDGVGELCVRGKSVSHGYYKDPVATAAVVGSFFSFSQPVLSKLTKRPSM